MGVAIDYSRVSNPQVQAARHDYFEVSEEFGFEDAIQ